MRAGSHPPPSGSTRVFVYVRDRKCFLPRGLSLELRVRMNLLSVVCSGLFGEEMSDSSVSRLTAEASDEAAGVYSI